MATGEVSAADGAIERGAKIVSDSKIALNTEIQSIESKLATIGAQWQGQSAAAFQSLIAAWREKARKITGNLDAFEENLRASQTNYSSSDDTSKSNMSRLQGRLG